MGTPVLDSKLAAFLAEPVTLILGSRNAALRGSGCYAIGCRADPTSGRVTLILDRQRAAGVVANLAEYPAVALVVCRPGTFRTVQLKGNDGREEPIDPADPERAAAYVEMMVIELGNIGDEAHWVRAAFGLDRDALTAVSFTPTEMYSQTPGTGAGERIP